MRKTGPGKKSGLEMIIRVCISGSIICVLLVRSCFAAESGNREIVVDGQIITVEDAAAPSETGVSETRVDGQIADGNEEAAESEATELIVDGQRVGMNTESVEQSTEAASEYSGAVETADRQNVETEPEGGNVPEEMQADDTLTELLTEVETLLPTENGEWSVYICDLSGGFEGCINEQSMQAASLIKLYIMGAVYERYDELTETYGKETIDANLKSMITVSDNEAANTLTGYLGSGDSETGMCAVSEYCLDQGFTCSSMGRLLLQSGTAGENYTSVRDCGRFLKAVYEKDTKTFPHAEEMFELLSEQTRRNKIPAQLPDGTSVANKTGELADVENDAGIIYDTEHDLVLVFMSQGLTDTAAAQQTIAELSRQIYESYNAADNKIAK